MTPEQRHAFEESGLVRLPGAVGAEVAQAIGDRVWARAAERLGIRRDDPASWRRVAPSSMKSLKSSEGLFDPLLGPAVAATLDALLGRGGWQAPAHPGQLIMTPPQPGPWQLPHAAWHMDWPAPGWAEEALPGVQLFLLLDALAPREGATLVVAGSHRLVLGLPERRDPDWEGHSAQCRKALRGRVPWLRDLWRAGPRAERIARFCGRAEHHEGIPLRVVELTGEPGDVYLMHPWMLHAASMNTGDRMRMMVTERPVREGVRLYAWSRG